MSRFDYVRYDKRAEEDQAKFTATTLRAEPMTRMGAREIDQEQP